VFNKKGLYDKAVQFLTRARGPLLTTRGSGTRSVWRRRRAAIRVRPSPPTAKRSASIQICRCPQDAS